MGEEPCVQELRGAEGGKIVITIYYIRKKLFSRKAKYRNKIK